LLIIVYFPRVLTGPTDFYQSFPIHFLI